PRHPPAPPSFPTRRSSDLQGIAVQGRQIAEQFHVMSGHLSTATGNLAESTALIKEEVRGIMTLADETAHVAKEKVEDSARFPVADRKSTRLNSSHSQISYA